MRCVVCRRGVMAPGESSILIERGSTTVVVKAIPAEVCGDCGEAVFSESVSDRLFELAEQAIARGAEVEILRYAA